MTDLGFISLGLAKLGMNERLVRVCAKSKSNSSSSPTILNREARFRYELLRKYECGIELTGSEIKSVRAGQMTLKDSFCTVKEGELFLKNVNIAPYGSTSAFFNHEPVRERRLMLHKRDIRKLKSEIDQKGMTLIATKAYFTARGWLKIEVALARGKNLADKRDTIKKREDDRQMKRAMKNISI
ncbi:hypothetical protein NDN08_001712 [Rhodosorus marinus]|uniref:SsrA-binding protein n=1 Tax=Rhodosorus marinus TaxID=101924 RepID=A0AAV8UUE1_9RHOD|nr:hypothetical protein NDN08_001712 [Rhodosorus marinus]